MAVLISCGAADANEREPLRRLAELLGPELAVLSNVPRNLAGREIDALLVGPHGVAVCELKYYRGALEARSTGAWLRNGSPITNAATGEEEFNFIDQAERAAQSLKSALVRFDPSLRDQIYIDRCVIITHPDSTLTYSRPELRDSAALLADARQVVEQTMRRVRKKPPILALNRIFAFAEQSVPASLAAEWRNANRDREPVRTAATGTENVRPIRPEVGFALPPNPSPASNSFLPPAFPVRFESPTPIPRFLVAGAVVGLSVIGWILLRGAPPGGGQNPPYPIDPFPVPQQEQISSPRVNLRSGPGPKFQVVKQMVHGDDLIGYGNAKSTESGTWQWVRLNDGTSGYINAKLVEPAQVPSQTVQVTTAAPATPAPPPEAPAPQQQPEASPSPPVPVEDQSARVRQMITSYNIWHDDAPDSGEVPGRSMVLRVDATYTNAREGDWVRGGIVQNGQVISRCNDFRIRPGDGSFWCRAAVFAPGEYQFVIGINGAPVLSHQFVIRSNAQQPAFAEQQNNQLRDQIVSAAARAIFNSIERHNRGSH